MRWVMKPDGQMHMEQDLGNMRMDLTTGERSMVIGDPKGMHTVWRQDGSTAMEWSMGKMRFSSDQSGFDTIFGE